jgi:hypothetical protein
LEINIFKQIKSKYLEQFCKANADNECPHLMNVTATVLDITLLAENLV